jgi:Flp pilus assembly protein TadG
MRYCPKTGGRNQRPAARRHGKIAEERAQALVELGLALPMLVVLLLGAVEFARAAYVGIEVSNAAKAAVQYGAQNSTTAADTTGMQTAATNEAPNITLGTPTVSTSYMCSNGTSTSSTPPTCTSGGTVETILTVNTQATYTPLIHVAGLGSSFTLYGQAVQKCLQC